MHKTTWKKGEMRIAKMFGTTRTPLSGGNSKITRSDTLSPDLFLEIKHVKRPPGNNIWLKATELAKKEKKIPALVFLKKNYPEPLILCKLSDIKYIFERLKGGKTEDESNIEEGSDSKKTDTK